MSPKLDRFAGPSSATDGSTSGRPGPAPTEAAACAMCGKPVAKPGLCDACAARPADQTFVLSKQTRPPSSSSAAVPDASPTTALRLGWLAVMRSIDRNSKGRVIALNDEVAVVARKPEPGDRSIEGQQVLFDDRFISHPHLRLARTSKGFELEVVDRSKNKAYVNDEEVQVGSRISLGDGDRIDVGTTRLVFRTLLIP